MTQIYLFDWGDTLMIDFPNQQGKMCNWETIQAVDGAKEMLAALSLNHQIYIATNAAESSEKDIQKAFYRVGLSQYITGYFCKSNLGIGKGSSEFFQRIIAQLNVEPQMITMVGDNLNHDIEPAVIAGIDVVWFNPFRLENKLIDGIKQIHKLDELYI